MCIISAVCHSSDDTVCMNEHEEYTGLIFNRKPYEERSMCVCGNIEDAVLC